MYLGRSSDLFHFLRLPSLLPVAKYVKNSSLEVEFTATGIVLDLHQIPFSLSRRHWTNERLILVTKLVTFLVKTRISIKKSDIFVKE